MTKPIYVMIPTCRRSLLLGRTLESLAQCDIPDNFAGVIVIENGKQEGAEAIVQAAPAHLKARYLFTAKANKSHALNFAIQDLSDGLIVFTDDDVRFDRHFLMAYAKAWASADDSHFFGGPFDVDYEHEPEKWLKPYLPPSAKGWGPVGDVPHDYYEFLGFNWAAPVSMLRAVGLFNIDRGPGMVATGQETDMQRRLVQAGYQTCYVSDAMVWHYVSAQMVTVDWVLARAERHGAGYGADVVQRGYRSIRDRIRPFWWKWYLPAMKATLVSWLLPMSPGRRLDAAYWWAYRRGVLKGQRGKL